MDINVGEKKPAKAGFLMTRIIN